MKHRGSNMECSEQRAVDLMRAYDRYVESAGQLRMPDVYRAVASMPASRFWVSEIRASLVVSAMLRGERPLERMWPLRREMYAEICRRVVELRKRNPDMSVSDACAEVVMQPAPSFYLTPGTVKVMICRYRKEWVRRKLARLSLWR
ncbi:MAG: hypothetical protein LUE27_09050 [Clostridia bacterium]|nr:hypothetical protein [Clostridia bacterium]